jgi:hypothetical protein
MASIIAITTKVEAITAGIERFRRSGIMVRRLKKTSADYDEFTTGLWNVLHEVPVAKQEDLLKKEKTKGVSLILMNEARDTEWVALLKEYGYFTFNHGQYRLAWNEDWFAVNLGHRRLSDQEYFTEAGKKQYNESAWGIFSDTFGRTLEVVSYHTAAYVQRPTGPERRRTSTLESFQTLGVMAENSVATGFLAGGDDNVDNRKGFGVDTDLWAPMMEASTGLREINAKTPTHGPEGPGGRNIDSYNVVPVKNGGGFRPVGIWDDEAPGDHDFVGAKWRWVRR